MSKRKNISNKSKREKRTIYFLIYIIVACIAIFIILWIKGINKKDYAPLEIDPNAIEMENEKRKLDADEGGGAVALSYSNKVSIDLKTNKITLDFKNPSRSTQDMAIEIIIEDNVIAKSGKIPVGYRIKELELSDKVKLKAGSYEGKFNVLYYDPDSSEKAVVNTDIPIKITVK